MPIILMNEKQAPSFKQVTIVIFCHTSFCCYDIPSLNSLLSEDEKKDEVTKNKDICFTIEIYQVIAFLCTYTYVYIGSPYVHGKSFHCLKHDGKTLFTSENLLPVCL